MEKSIIKTKNLIILYQILILFNSEFQSVTECFFAEQPEIAKGSRNHVRDSAMPSQARQRHLLLFLFHFHLKLNLKSVNFTTPVGVELIIQFI
jgi:hypothetical protein